MVYAVLQGMLRQTDERIKQRESSGLPTENVKYLNINSVDMEKQVCKHCGEPLSSEPFLINGIALCEICYLSFTENKTHDARWCNESQNLESVRLPR